MAAIHQYFNMRSGTFEGKIVSKYIYSKTHENCTIKKKISWKHAPEPP